jgi:hypothetical protein
MLRASWRAVRRRSMAWRTNLARLVLAGRVENQGSVGCGSPTGHSALAIRWCSDWCVACPRPAIASTRENLTHTEAPPNRANFL